MIIKRMVGPQRNRRKRDSLVCKLMARDSTLLSYQALELANKILSGKKGFGKKSFS